MFHMAPQLKIDGVTSTERPDKWDKIYRNMFHLQGKQMIQGRVYPQSKDGQVDLYKVMRFAMQKALCEMFGMDYVDSGNGNDTWVMKGKTYINSSWYNSRGVHYSDYSRYDDCNLSYVRGCEDTLPIRIGHLGIDVRSGEEFSSAENLSQGTRWAILPSDFKQEVTANNSEINTYIPE